MVRAVMLGTVGLMWLAVFGCVWMLTLSGIPWQALVAVIVLLVYCIFMFFKENEEPRTIWKVLWNLQKK